MNTYYQQNIILVCVLALLYVTSLQAGEWSGKVTTEYRSFTESPLNSVQHGNTVSISAEPEYYLEWQENQSLLIKLFARSDEGDKKRTHADVREFVWQKAANNWELKIGIDKVYWGVSESQHLVDIINQTDLVESIDLEEKLGQTLVNLSLIKDWGNIDFYILPLFRERTFPGVNGRLRPGLYVDTTQVGYESTDREKHIDYALRIFRTYAKWDIGVSAFSGTSRDPRLLPGLNNQNQLVLVPFYDLITQYSLDVQATFDSWLLKMEWINRDSKIVNYNAATLGFEYTFYGILDTDLELGLIMEYLYDDRGKDATTPFQNDVFLGTRWVVNDAQSTELLLGFIADIHINKPSINVEASRRLTDHFKLNLEARIFSETKNSDPINAFRNDDYVQLELEYFF